MKTFTISIVLLFVMNDAISQTAVIDNFLHSPGYVTGKWGELGAVTRAGTGAQDVILIAGWGFDGSIFDKFVGRHEKEFRMWTVTLPGFGVSRAPAMPEKEESYGELYWTRGIMKGMVDLIKKEKMNKPVLISYFTCSNLIAMRLGLEHPDLVGPLIVISGMAKFTGPYPSFEPRSLKDRVRYIDDIISKKWFKTVTRETWDNGNFTPATFTKDSIVAMQYWNMMSSVPIPVMVRYLCEMYSTDISLQYNKLTVPMMVVLPAFTTEFLSNPVNAYAPAMFHHSWIGALPANEKIQMVALRDTQAFIMDDQPDKLDKIIREFLNHTFNPFPALR